MSRYRRPSASHRYGPSPRTSTISRLWYSGIRYSSSISMIPRSASCMFAPFDVCPFALYRCLDRIVPVGIGENNLAHAAPHGIRRGQHLLLHASLRHHNILVDPIDLDFGHSGLWIVQAGEQTSRIGEYEQLLG